MKKVDLHIHSNASLDADYSPKELVNFAKNNSVTVMAVADHNQVSSIDKTIVEGNLFNIKVIPAIEIDCQYKGLNIHVLGYNIDYKDLRYKTIGEYYHSEESKTSRLGVDKLCEFLNITISEEDLLKIQTKGVIIAENVAALLIGNEKYKDCSWLKPYLDGGSRSDNPNVNFYWDYFSQGKPAYSPMKYLEAVDIIKLIHETGGISVIAHPGNNFKNNLSVFDDLLKEGIDGIEVYSSYHTNEQVDYFYKKAIDNNLKITCGSDFHGHHKPKIKLGEISFIKDINEILC